MPKSVPTGVLQEPLDALLGTRAKVAVLRELARSATPLSVAALARRTGMAYRSIDLAARDLLAMGLLLRILGGRERLVQLQSAHRLAPVILALLRSEADFFPAFCNELRAVGARGEAEGLVAVALVGKAATGELGIGSAAELVIIASDPASAARWEARYQQTADGLKTRYGVSCQLLTYDLEAARRLWRNRTTRAESTVATAQALIGRPLGELFNDIAKQ